MTVSVIVPAYNIEKELPRCLDSLLAQSWQDIQIVVVNDGSTDGTGRVLDEYGAKDSRIVAIHKENGGVTSARLAGIAASTGDVIGFVDGDDVVEPEMFSILVKNLLEYNADISHCGYQMDFADGRSRCFHGTGVLEVMDREKGLGELIAGTRVEPALWNKIYRRKLLVDTLEDCPLDSSIRNFEDLLMNYWLFARAERSVFEDVCPYHYLVRATSASRAALNPHRIYDPLKVKDIIRRNAPEALRNRANCAYVGMCMDTYNLILAEKGTKSDRKAVRALLAAEKSSFSLLSRKRRLMGNAILYGGGLYRGIYALYKWIRPRSIYQ